MTLQRDTPESSARFVPPDNRTYFQDVINTQNFAPPTPRKVTGLPPDFRVDHIGSQGEWDLFRFHMRVYDASGGFVQADTFDRAHNCVASGSLDTRGQRELTLPQLVTEQTPITLTPTWVTHAEAFGFHVLGIAEIPSNNGVLYRETSSADPLLVQLVFASGSRITHIAPITLNNVQYLGVSRAGDGMLFLEDLNLPAPTVNGTEGSAGTANAWGWVETLLGHYVMFLESGVATLPLDAALNDTPTLVTTDINFVGGYPLGLARLNNSEPRVWYVRPKTFEGFGVSGIDLAGGFKPMEIISVNQLGFDAQPLTTLGVPYIYHATLWRDGLLYANEDTINFFGRIRRGLQWRRQRAANSDRITHCLGLWPVGLSGVVVPWDILDAAGNFVETGFDYYDWDLDAWCQISKSKTRTSLTGIQTWPTRGTNARSESTRFIHSVNATDKFYRQYVPEGDINPWSLRKTADATAGTGREYEETDTLTMTEWTLPGYEGAEYLVSHVIGPKSNDIKAGGTGAYAQYSVGGKAAKFTARERAAYQPRKDLMPQSNWLESLQLTVTAARGTTDTDATRLAVQAFPVTIEGYMRMRTRQSLPPNWAAGVSA